MGCTLPLKVRELFTIPPSDSVVLLIKTGDLKVELKTGGNKSSIIIFMPLREHMPFWVCFFKKPRECSLKREQKRLRQQEEKVPVALATRLVSVVTTKLHYPQSEAQPWVEMLFCLLIPPVTSVCWYSAQGTACIQFDANRL